MQNTNSIVETVFDIFFETNSITESFLGDISKINNFDNITKLPMFQIPEAIRRNDPNLKFHPLYEIRSKTNKNYKIMLGDGMLGIAIIGNYRGWSDSFLPQIKELFGAFLDSEKIITIKRIGLRYVNFFETENIFETGKISVNLDKTCKKKMFLRVEDCIKDICYSKTITNEAQYENVNTSVGSIIDIVTFIEEDKKELKKETLFDDINRLHDISKNKFKEVISDEYIRKHNL